MNSKYLGLFAMVCLIGIANHGVYNVDAATHYGDPCFFEKMKSLKWLCEPIPPPPVPNWDKMWCNYTNSDEPEEREDCSKYD